MTPWIRRALAAKPSPGRGNVDWIRTEPRPGRADNGGVGKKGGFYCGQDAVIRKCIFTNEVTDGGVKRAVMADEGRREGTPTGKGRAGGREGGRRWLLVWVVNHGAAPPAAAGPGLLEADLQGIPS